MEVLRRAIEIAEKGVPVLEKYKINQFSPVLDYVDIFPKSQEEYDTLIPEIRVLGKPVYKTESGATFQLHETLNTEVGDLWLLKVRKFDPTKVQFLGHPDFSVSDYQAAKAHLLKYPKVNMIVRPKYEMIEIWDTEFEVTVYIPNLPLSEDVKNGTFSD